MEPTMLLLIKRKSINKYVDYPDLRKIDYEYSHYTQDQINYLENGGAKKMTNFSFKTKSNQEQTYKRVKRKIRKRNNSF